MAQRPLRFPGIGMSAGVQDFSLGPKLGVTLVPMWHGRLVMRDVLQRRPCGTALEFGVGTGTSLRQIAEVMPVVGFDSFDGLPEDWREGFDAGSFACTPPDVPNATLVKGLFADTLPTFTWPDQVGLVHIDCDLYSSTKTVLEHVGPHLQWGTYLVFDEYHTYPGHEEHEMKAWREFAEATGITWSVIGHGPEQWAIQVT